MAIICSVTLTKLLVTVLVPVATKVRKASLLPYLDKTWRNSAENPSPNITKCSLVSDPIRLLCYLWAARSENSWIDGEVEMG